MNRAAPLFVLVAVLFIGLGLFAGRYWLAPQGNALVEPALKPSDMIGQARPDFRHADLDGQWVTPADFDGQVVLVNFWATWCAPCRKEMPMLVELADSYRERGVVVIGIALDGVQPVRDYVAELGISYPILIGASDVMATNRRYGNPTGALPYSVLIDRSGTVRWTRLGELHRDDVVARFEQLL